LDEIKEDAMALSLAWSGLAARLAGIAAPLAELREPGKAQVDAAMKQAEGQTQLGAKPAATAAPVVRRAVAVAQVVHLEASPALSWEATGWRCQAEPTVIELELAGGACTTCTYSAGTFIPVAAGMIHFPDPVPD
jgi:hypothetical protein